MYYNHLYSVLSVCLFFFQSGFVTQRSLYCVRNMNGEYLTREFLPDAWRSYRPTNSIGTLRNTNAFSVVIIVVIIV